MSDFEDYYYKSDEDITFFEIDKTAPLISIINNTGEHKAHIDFDQDKGSFVLTGDWDDRSKQELYDFLMLIHKHRT